MRIIRNPRRIDVGLICASPQASISIALGRDTKIDSVNSVNPVLIMKGGWDPFIFGIRLSELAILRGAI